MAQDIRDSGQDSYAPPEGSDNNAYRLFNQSGFPEEDPLVQIEEDSLRAIAAGDDALFAEGAPVEQLGGDLPSSIIQARTMDSPLVDDFGLESMAPFSDNRELNFDYPMGDTASESMLSPDPLERFDTSTGVPMNMNEVEQSVFRERIDAADAGLTNIQTQVDRFPQEDLRTAEQEAELFDIRNRSLSDNERLQMAMPEDGGFIPRFPGDVPEWAELQRRDPTTAMPNTAVADPDADADADADAADGADGADGPEVDGPSGVNLGDLDADITDNPGDAGALTSGALLRSAGVDTSNMGIQERTVAMRDMLNDLMGQTDADEKEEFWMNMAMVGFGIAAGESSDAMKNIADGLLAGTAQITKGKADKRARNDSLTTLAFGEVLADERAREKFGRDLQLAGVRAGEGGNLKTRAARNPLDFKQDIYKSAFAAFDSSVIKPADALAGETATEYATRMADAAYRYAMGGPEIPDPSTLEVGDRANDDDFGMMIYTDTGWVVDPDQSPE
jgi:hypothetical protein